MRFRMNFLIASTTIALPLSLARGVADCPELEIIQRFDLPDDHILAGATYNDGNLLIAYEDGTLRWMDVLSGNVNFLCEHESGIASLEVPVDYAWSGFTYHVRQAYEAIPCGEIRAERRPCDGLDWTGMAWNGNDILLVSDGWGDSKYMSVDPNWNFDCDRGDARDGTTGLAYDGTSYWSCHYDNSNIYRINASTLIEECEYSFPQQIRNPSGIAWDPDNESLWVVHQDGATQLKVNCPDLERVSQFTPSEVCADQAFLLKVRYRNDGGPSGNEGYVNIGLPCFKDPFDNARVELHSMSPGGTYREYPAGTTIYGRDRQPMEAEYLLCEAQFSDWPAGQEKWLEIQVTVPADDFCVLDRYYPEFVREYRAAAICGSTYIEEPEFDTNCPKDQQGHCADKGVVFSGEPQLPTLAFIPDPCAPCPDGGPTATFTWQEGGDDIYDLYTCLARTLEECNSNDWWEPKHDVKPPFEIGWRDACGCNLFATLASRTDCGTIGPDLDDPDITLEPCSPLEVCSPQYVLVRDPAKTVITRSVLGFPSPNPSNPSVRIPFDVAEAGTLRLEVFDGSGRLVTVLVNEHMERGSHAVRWDGRDANGKASPSGAYIVRLTTGNESLFQRAILLK